jgi:hypothetical protein
LAVLALVAVLAGCGGGGGGGGNRTTTEAGQGMRVVGDGFTFSAPPSWHVSHASTTVTVRPGGEGPTLASVTALTLRRRYSPALFAKTARETDRIAAALAGKLGGKVIARRTVVVGAVRVRQYDLAYQKGGSGLIDRITFVFRGKEEYYVLCRWPADKGEPDACGLLQTTFAVR